MADDFNTLDQPVTAASIGALPLTGGTVTGDIQLQDATPTKGYRFRTSGGGLDLEAAGTQLVVSVWSAAGFSGSQRTYAVLENGAQILQLCKVVQFRESANGATRHQIDGSAGGGVVFNEDGADADTRIEGDTDANLVFVDASADMVAVGASDPAVKFDVNGDSIRVRTAKTPASASAAGVAGQVCWDANFIYVAVATNTWKRAALSTW